MNILLILLVIVVGMVIYNNAINEIDEKRTYARGFLFTTVALLIILIVALNEG